MNNKKISVHLGTIAEAMDFIAANSDADQTGKSLKLMSALSRLKKDLMESTDKQSFKSNQKINKK